MLFLDYSIAFEECVNRWLAATESAVKFHWFSTTTTLEDILAIEFGCFLIEDATVFLLCGLENREGISIKEFGPLIAIVTSRIAAKYAGWRIDDAKLIDTPDGSHYRIEIEKNDRDRTVKITAAGEII